VPLLLSLFVVHTGFLRSCKMAPEVKEGMAPGQGSAWSGLWENANLFVFTLSMPYMLF